MKKQLQMDYKKTEIQEQQNRQAQLKKEIKNRRANIPTFLIGLLALTICLLYFFKDKVHVYFGNIFNFIAGGSIIFITISAIYLFFSIKTIKKKTKMVSNINKKLYKLMKL